VPCPKMKVWAPKVPPGPHPLARHGQQFDICFPSLHQDVTAGWAASPVGTRPPGPHLTLSWVDWNNVSKGPVVAVVVVSLSKEHTQTHTHTNTHTHTHTYAYTCGISTAYVEHVLYYYTSCSDSVNRNYTYSD